MTPVNVVTGFLGSGKTTLIAKLLRDPRLHDTAVIVNEFGEVGLDHVLVEAADQEVVLLQQGCLCCMLNGSLSATLESLDARRISGKVPNFQRVVVETTGLADPVPVLQTLLDRAMLLRGYRLARAVTTVDATAGYATLNRYAEAVRQVAIADKLLVTKRDLVSDTNSLNQLLRGINSRAPLVAVLHGAIPPEEFLADAPPWDSDMVPASRCVAEASPHHRIQSVTLRFPAPVPFGPFADWLGDLVGAHGDKLLRVKGIVAIEGHDQPLLVHGVQHIFHPPRLLEAWPRDLVEPALVFITDGLEPGLITKSATRSGFNQEDHATPKEQRLSGFLSAS
jgi:G3E family GTPase